MPNGRYLDDIVYKYIRIYLWSIIPTIYKENKNLIFLLPGRIRVCWRFRVIMGHVPHLSLRLRSGQASLVHHPFSFVPRLPYEYRVSSNEHRDNVQAGLACRLLIFGVGQLH